MRAVNDDANIMPDKMKIVPMVLANGLFGVTSPYLKENVFLLKSL